MPIKLMSMAPTPREKKASRITTACNPCRARKQKCSGERPRCEQCLEYGRACAWPEQLKRGPAKGYIETLENRLHETEHLLLKLLAHVSDDELSKIISQDQALSCVNSNSSPDPHRTPMVLGTYSLSVTRKTGAEYWKRFPLSSTESIRRWERDCCQHHYVGSFAERAGNAPSGSAATIVSGNGGRDTNSRLSSVIDEDSLRNGAIRAHIEDTAMDDSPSLESSSTTRQKTNGYDRGPNFQQGSERGQEETRALAADGVSPEQTTNEAMQQYQHRDENPQAEYENDLHDNRISYSAGGREYHVTNINTDATPSRIMDPIHTSTPILTQTAPTGLSSWDAAPPLKFQRQFLW